MIARLSSTRQKYTVRLSRVQSLNGFDMLSIRTCCQSRLPCAMKFRCYPSWRLCSHKWSSLVCLASVAPLLCTCAHTITLASRLSGIWLLRSVALKFARAGACCCKPTWPRFFCYSVIAVTLTLYVSRLQACSASSGSILRPGLEGRSRVNIA